MKTLTVVSEDRLGLLADMSYMLSKAGVSIEGLCADVVGGKAILSVEVRDASRAADVLTRNGFTILPEEAIILKLSQKDATGLESMLKEQKIVVSNVAEISADDADKVVALNVDKPRRASRLLGPFIFGNKIYCTPAPI